MDVLIKGISMPDEREWIDVRVFRNGTAIVTGERAHREECKAIFLPPHGKLIDVDEAGRRFPVEADPRNGYMLYKLNNELSTIIEAEPPKEET